MGLVYGVGTYEKGKYRATEGGKINYEYGVWRGMLKRCYCENDLIRYPTYRGCYVSEEFLNFQSFAAWLEKQVGYREVGYQLDKDILTKGNKVYNSNSCVLVPPIINMFWTMDRSNSKEGMPIGVCYTSGTINGKIYTYLKAYLNDSKGNRKSLGSFTSLESASEAYINAKKHRALELAEEFNGKVDDRVISALLNFN